MVGTGGKSPVATYAAGAVGDAALMSLTRALGGASLEDGIRVVGVNPGPIMTDRLESGCRIQAEKRFGDSSRWAECMDGFPTYGHPPGEPHHIADMVTFLASDLSAYTTGTIITIDGGHRDVKCFKKSGNRDHKNGVRHYPFIMNRTVLSSGLVRESAERLPKS